MYVVLQEGNQKGRTVYHFKPLTSVHWEEDSMFEKMRQLKQTQKTEHK